MGAEFLRRTARHGDTLMVHFLLEAGVNANAGDDLGSTALHKAAKGGHAEVVRTLIYMEQILMHRIAQGNLL